MTAQRDIPAKALATTNTYTNARFGYQLAYPAQLLTPQREADNGDGRAFVSKNGRTTLLVYGSLDALKQGIGGYYQESLRIWKKKPDTAITYQPLKAKWFAVSGTQGARIFYQKTFAVQDRFVTFSLTYPKSEQKVWDRVITQINASFRP